MIAAAGQDCERLASATRWGPNKGLCWGGVFDCTLRQPVEVAHGDGPLHEECLVPEVGRGLSSDDLIDTVAEYSRCGRPRYIYGHNSPDFIADELRA